MKFTHSFIVAAATFNLTIGAPVDEEKSRAVVTEDAVRRVAANNPYFVHHPERVPGSVTPGKVRSVLNLIKRRSRKDKRYGCGENPDPRSVEDLSKRYTYRDTPVPQSVEDLNKRYQYGSPEPEGK